jgi:hypothetical protein
VQLPTTNNGWEVAAAELAYDIAIERSVSLDPTERFTLAGDFGQQLEEGPRAKFVDAGR